MTTISIINGFIIKDGRPIVADECGMGAQVANIFEYLSKNRIDMTLSGHSGIVSISVGNYTCKQKLIQALIEDKVIQANQLLYSA